LSLGSGILSKHESIDGPLLHTNLQLVHKECHYNQPQGTVPHEDAPNLITPLERLFQIVMVMMLQEKS
jgi:hypothetical protein